MNEDFFSVHFERGRDEHGYRTLTIHVGWGVIWLAAAVVSVLVMTNAS